MAQTVHKRHIDDLKTPLDFTFVDDAGDAVNLTWATSVTFTMVDSVGEVVVNAQAGSFTNKSTGGVRYNFVAADVDEAGIYYGYFAATNGSSPQTSPPQEKKLKIIIYEK